MEEDVESSDVEIPINNNSKFQKIIDESMFLMWASLILGILLGACVCGFANQLSNMIVFVYVIEMYLSWWIWLILITILSILFLWLESRLGNASVLDI